MIIEENDEELFQKEKFGMKTNVVDFLTQEEEEEILEKARWGHEPYPVLKYIRVNSPNPALGEYFLRKITDITKVCELPNGRRIYIFSWMHEV